MSELSDIYCNMWRVLLSLGIACICVQASQDFVSTFTDPVPTPNSFFNHLVVDHNTGRMYIGAINKIYQLSPDLEVEHWIATGPINDSVLCAFDCPSNFAKKLTDNVNKVMIIDYASSRLITCGSVLQGMCSVLNLNNINIGRDVNRAIVANDPSASTVAFIAPGPPNPSGTQVMYVGVTFTGNSLHRHEIPAVSSRSLDDKRLFEIAELFCEFCHSQQVLGTRMYVSTQYRESYIIDYVYGFSSGGFSYFVTTQRFNSDYHSSLVRICHDDEQYSSYTEIPIICKGDNGNNINYNIVQAATFSIPGSDLARELEISTDEGVLFAVFSTSVSNQTSINSSAICVFSLQSIRRKFSENIETCFRGDGMRGLQHMLPNRRCIKRELENPIHDLYGANVNSPLGGSKPVEAMPVQVFEEILTSVAATIANEYTILFAGTAQGHLKKIVIETATTGFEYEDIVIDEGSPVNKDLVFDPQLMHLYVMTKRKVSKVKVQNCNDQKSFINCSKTKDPYCGWCSLENKCSLRTECQEGEDHLFWITCRTDCPVINKVIPNELQLSKAQILFLEIDNMPSFSTKLICSFSVLKHTLFTNATRNEFFDRGIFCPTPHIIMLPEIPVGQHHFTAKLSVRTIQGPDFAATKVTFFDCSTYTSCTQCTNSYSPCVWCMGNHHCIHSTTDICLDNSILADASHCPTLNSAIDGTNEILVPSGAQKAIQMKVDFKHQFVSQMSFSCIFKIEEREINVNAQLYGDSIFCDAVKFIYTSSSSIIIAAVDVIWDGSETLDNPNNTHIVIYHCSYMASDCNNCLTYPEKFACGWCKGSNKCQIKGQCDAPSTWLDRSQTCLYPEIHTFKPQLGPWEGGTNITINGIKLGRNISDINNGVTIAGIKCQPITDLYVKAKQIVCTVDGPGEEVQLDGPVVVRVADYREESKHHYAFVDPKINSIQPKYGPQSGGTKLRITGEYLNAGSNIQAYIDDLPCVILSVSHEEAVCRTSHSSQGIMGTLRMHFDNGMRTLRREKFEYIEDPVVVSVESGPSMQRKQPKGIPSGGLDIKVTGRNFHSIQFPKIYVYHDNRSYDAPCHRIDFQARLLCESPVIEIGDHTLDPDKPLELEYGFIMDNVQSVQNLTSKTGDGFLLYPDPIFEKFDTVKALYPDVTIFGQNIDRAATVDGVQVQLHASLWNDLCAVTAMTRNYLKCRPPPPDVLPNEDTLQVVVKVGRNLTYKIGKVSYQ